MWIVFPKIRQYLGKQLPFHRNLAAKSDKTHLFSTLTKKLSTFPHFMLWKTQFFMWIISTVLFITLWKSGEETAALLAEKGLLSWCLPPDETPWWNFPPVLRETTLTAHPWLPPVLSAVPPSEYAAEIHNDADAPAAWHDSLSMWWQTAPMGQFPRHRVDVKWISWYSLPMQNFLNPFYQYAFSLYITSFILHFITYFWL